MHKVAALYCTAGACRRVVKETPRPLNLRESFGIQIRFGGSQHQTTGIADDTRYNWSDHFLSRTRQGTTAATSYIQHTSSTELPPLRLTHRAPSKLLSCVPRRSHTTRGKAGLTFCTCSNTSAGVASSGDPVLLFLFMVTTGVLLSCNVT